MTEPQPRSTKILVVEDERIVARDIEQGLQGLGYCVVGVVNKGSDAIKIARKKRPDIVLMDIRIKGKIDGIQTASRIGRLFNIPSIFLTAYADENTLTEAKKAEPIGYLLKPFNESRLRSTIEIACHKIHLLMMEKTKATAEAMSLKKRQTKQVELIGNLKRAVQHYREIFDKQKMIVQTAKMTALGEMAGGVAHEINTPLAAIVLNSGMLRDQINEESRDKKELLTFIESLESCAFRIAEIVKGLLFFSRGSAKETSKRMSVKTILENTLDFCRERIRGNGIELRLCAISPELEIECNAPQISQVILNLINNAYDAVERLEERWIEIDVQDRGHFIKISIADSGLGIKPEIQDKIMQPFFTTKEIGKGIGLGLSISKGIIENHKGSIELDTQSPHTRFLITLPKF